MHTLSIIFLFSKFLLKVIEGWHWRTVWEVGTQWVQGEAMKALRFWPIACIQTVAKWYPDQWAPTKPQKHTIFAFNCAHNGTVMNLFLLFKFAYPAHMPTGAHTITEPRRYKSVQLQLTKRAYADMLWGVGCGTKPQFIGIFLGIYRVNFVKIFYFVALKLSATLTLH